MIFNQFVLNIQVKINMYENEVSILQWVLLRPKDISNPWCGVNNKKVKLLYTTWTPVFSHRKEVMWVNAGKKNKET